MGLRKTAEKLDDYYDRMKAGRAKKIKPHDVKKAISKFQARERELLIEIENADKPAKKERLTQKLATTRDLISRAKWLLEQIN